MNMLDAVKSVLTQYFGFSGRARRSEFWFWVLATILVAIVIALIESLMMGIPSNVTGPISTIYILLIFIPGLAVSFRRLHDIGRTGWWIGGFFLAVIVFLIIMASISFGMVTGSASINNLTAFGFILIAALFGAFIYWIVLLVFFCQDSVAGPNKYGPNPKNEGNYDIFE